MIYQQPEHKKPFDDSIIRSVDSVVNSTFYKDSASFSSQIPNEMYEREFRTVFMQLPRQCGKTVYLSKLLDRFQMMGFHTWLVVPKMTMKRELYSHHSSVLTLHEIAGPDRVFCFGLNGRRYSGKPDVMLYDEVYPDNEKIIPGCKFTLGLYT